MKRYFFFLSVFIVSCTTYPITLEEELCENIINDPYIINMIYQDTNIVTQKFLLTFADSLVRADMIKSIKWFINDNGGYFKIGKQELPTYFLVLYKYKSDDRRSGLVFSFSYENGIQKLLNISVSGIL